MRRATRYGFEIALVATALVGGGLWLFAEPVLAPTGTLPPASLPEAPVPLPRISDYIEVTDGCGPHFEGACAVVRSGPATTTPVVKELRSGIVLAVASSTQTDETGRVWYRVIFDEWVRYPERIGGDWYVAADAVQQFEDVGSQELALAELSGLAKPSKHILIDRSEQMLYAYDGDTLFMESPISTGLELTPTPRGVFAVYKKTPSRYMQGPLPGISDQYYDLPGVPWNLYFTAQGGAIHGTYWHDNFGQPWSHGCVNVPLGAARTLYEWTPLGAEVIVRD